MVFLSKPSINLHGDGYLTPFKTISMRLNAFLSRPLVESDDEHTMEVIVHGMLLSRPLLVPFKMDHTSCEY